jgi:hypothetical protein
MTLPLVPICSHPSRACATTTPRLRHASPAQTTDEEIFRAAPAHCTQALLRPPVETFSSDRARPPSMFDPNSFLDGTLKGL